jgi:hypothetical protein
MPMKPRGRGLLVWAHDFGPWWLNLAADAGLTNLGLHPVPGLPEDDPRSLEALLERMRTEAFRADVRALKARGIELTVEAHAMHWLLPRTHFADHPDWFRMDENGERTNDLNCCPSSEEALLRIEINTETFVKEIAEVSDAHRYHLWMDDNSKYCRCDACRALSPSDQAMTVYNRMLIGVRKADPKGTLAYLAYQGTMRPPATVEPSEGIFLEYAPVDRDSRFALDDPEIEKNAAETSPVPALLALFGKDGSQALEYCMDVSYFYRWKAPYGELPFYRGVIRADARYYRELGFERLTSFACGLNAGYERRYGQPPVTEYGTILKEEFI